jgi:hypothetical protein
MNQKQLTLLIILGVVVGGLGWYVYSKKQAGYERGSASPSADGQKLLKGVPANAINDVAAVSIRQGSSEVNLARGADGWTVKERGHYPANFDTLSDNLKKLWDLKVTRTVEAGPSRLPALKLTKPDATFVDLKDDKGKSVVALTLGLQATRDSGNESPFGGGSFPSGRYVMRGEDIKTLALVGDPLSGLDPKPEDWLNKNWFKIEKPRSISVTGTNAANTWKFSRTNETADWKLADLKPGENEDPAKAGNLGYVLSSPQFNDVVVDPKPEKTGLATPATAVIETLDGFTYTIKIGKGEGENFAMTVAVSGDFPKERVAGKDEKKEDKEKLDKEFADKRKTFEDKLKTEKSFEKWTYLVSNWTVENLLKPRKDYLLEKKEEAKAEPPAVPLAPPFAPPAK